MFTKGSIHLFPINIVTKDRYWQVLNTCKRRVLAVVVEGFKDATRSREVGV